MERSHLFRLGQSDFYSLISERPDVTQAINRVLKAPDTAGRSSVAVILSSDMKMTTTEGEIYPGAALQPKQAKLLAYRILAIAAEIEAEPI
ncbi:MAG: hypothetical protein M3Y27_23425 [Acidobacteriota bacterium]|nr:hypothetical protein [Acidobacteriota bacterium]